MPNSHPPLPGPAPDRYLSPTVRSYFANLQNSYLSIYTPGTPDYQSAVTRFAAFFDNIDRSATLSQRLNDSAIVTAATPATLNGIELATGGSRANYQPSQTEIRWVSNSFRWVATNSPGGVLRFDRATIDAVGLHAASRQIFVAAHEAGHAQYAVAAGLALRAALNTASDYLKQQQALITANHSANQINMTAQVRAAVDTMMREEGRATLNAYNDMIARLNKIGQPITDADRLAILQGSGFEQYLITSTGALVAGLTANSQGFLNINDANIQAAANANFQWQFANPSPTSHNVTYAAYVIGALCSQPSNATLLIDTDSLGLTYSSPNGNFTLLDALNVARNSVFSTGSNGNTGQCRVVNTRTGEARTIVTTASGTTMSSVVVSPPAGDASPPPGAAAALDFNSENGFDTRDRNYDPATGEQFPSGIWAHWTGLGWTHVDARGREVTFVRDRDGRITQSMARDGRQVSANGTVEYGVAVIITYDSDGRAIATDIKLNDNPLGIEFSQAGGILGGQLGTLIAGDNELVSIVSSAALRTVGDNLGDVFDGLIGHQSVNNASRDAFATFGPEFLSNLKAAGIGAVSTYLTAQLVDALGVSGFAAELTNTVAGTVINAVLTNIATGASNPFAGLDSMAAVPTAIGSFLGNRLANEIVSFDTIGGQLGSAIGSSLGVIAVTSAIGANGTLLGLELGAFAGPLGAVAGAFLGTILGGVIGSVFGGTPRSGADVVWDEARGEFAVANVYSKKGGSKDAAQAMASAVAGTFNGIIAATGGVLMDPSAVQAGNYGMRKKDYVYRPYSTTDKDAITARFSGKDAADRLIGYGLYQGLADSDFKIFGGDVYIKRAVYNGLVGLDSNNFDAAVVLGNIAAAQRYETYLANASAVDALVAAEDETVFTAEWAITFARAVELGLTRRHESDWYGGFGLLLDEAQTNAANVAFGFDYDLFAEKPIRMMQIGEFLVGDTIDVAGQTVIEAGAANNIIKLTGTRLAATSGTTNAGLTVNGAAHNGAALDIDVAATVDAGGGNDTVYASDRGDNVFGGAGDDKLYGGKLDDWLMGGDGNDSLFAGGPEAGTLGGDGNYLDGGAGNDVIKGREGSDWLEGGDGTDTIDGLGGDDVLAGGAGAGDLVRGGAGDDQYLFRRGDGADRAEDSAGTVVSGGPDPLRARLQGIAAGLIARDWIGEGAWAPDTPSQGAATAGISLNAGEDRLVLGQGIGLGDVQLARGGAVAGTTSSDLILEVMTTDAAGVRTWSGDRLVMKDWYNSYSKIEWLEFADGQALRIADFQTFIAGTPGNDVIIGTEGRDFAVGGDGDDWLSLLAGDDVGVGGAGKDWVSGDADDDLLVGGNDEDHVLGGSGNDVLSGDAAKDELDGGSGADVLAGGRGDGDVVTGGSGDDVFRYSRGDGRDSFIDTVAGTWEEIWSNGVYQSGFERDAQNRVLRGTEIAFDGTNWLSKVQFDVRTQKLTQLIPTAGRSGQDASVAGELGDAIEFGLGINIQDVMLAQYGYDLVLGISSENAEQASFISLADQVALKDWYYTANRPIERIIFAATGELNAETTSLIGGTDGNDSRTGTTGADWMTGNGGDDTLTASAGNDILNGNAGSDSLIGGAGDDVIYGGAGNDVLEGGDGLDLLIGGAGEDTASYASAGAAVAVYLSAPVANVGDARNDAFYSIEHVTGSANNDYAIGGDSADNVLAGGAGNDALFGGAGNDTYVWNAWDYGDTIDDRPFSIDEVVGADGQLRPGYQVTLWEATALPQSGSETRYYWRLQITGPGGEVVYDFNRYTPTAADPAVPVPSAYIQSGWKNGFSRVLNGASNGQQVLRQRFSTADGGEDNLELGAGISLSDLSFEVAGADLIVRYQANDSNYIRIKGQSNAGSRIEWLQLNDGLAVSLASLRVVGSTGGLTGTTAADFLIGRDLAASADTISGLAGDDVISGLAGDDVLSGGDGDDVIEGGAGADRIDGGANSAIGSTVTAGDTVRYLNSGAVTVDLGNTTTAQADGDILTGIENVVGSLAGGDSLTGSADGNRLAGLGGDDTLSGLAGDDVLDGGEGDDYLYGGDGDDNISGSDGIDQVWGGLGTDLIDGGAGNDVLRGEGGNDTLTAGDGNDTADGGSENDDISGGAGNDTLRGQGGNDRLIGGAGTDRLEGSTGNDVYVFDASSGTDTIVDTSGVNDIVFDASVDVSRIWLSKVNNGLSLRIGLIGSTASITVSNFFAATGKGLIHSIQTTTHGLFLDHPEAASLINAMTAISATPPAAMPQSISDMLGGFWHEGGKAVPRASALSLSTNEDTPLTVASLGVIDHDQNISGYQIASAASHGAVTLNAATGAFTYTPASDFNGTDSFSVRVLDVDGHAVEVPIQIAVQSVNDAPTPPIVVGGTLQVSEAAATGATVAQLQSTDADGDALTYSLVNDAGGRFDISSGGLLVLSAPALVDFEASTSHQIRVRVADPNGGSIEKDLSVAVLDANDAPAFVGGLSLNIDENVPAGTSAGSVQAEDQDPAITDWGKLRYWFLNGSTASLTSSDGRYTINNFTGAVTAKVSTLNFEAPSPSKNYTVIVRDNDGAAGYNQAKASVTIAINDCNDAPKFAGNFALSVNENVAPGSLVGNGQAVAATDLDSTDSAWGQLRYYFGDGTTATSDGRYVIDTYTGVITTSGALNREAPSPSKTYTVIARDNNGATGYNQAQTNVTISIADINEANSLLPSYSFTVDENASLTTTVGTILATDLDDAATDFGQQRYYFLDNGVTSGTSFDGRYAIDAVTGVITPNAALNREGVTPATSYIVVARDNAGVAPYNAVSTRVDITIADVNEAPTATRWTPSLSVVPERDRIAGGVARPALVIGTFDVDDPDAAGTAFATYTYSFSDDRFTITGGSLVLKQGASLDFEAEASIALEVTATDQPGVHSIRRTLTITVGNQDDIAEGDSGANVLVGQQNRDLIYGFGGDDTLDGGSGNDELFGDTGNDKVIGGAGIDVLHGGDGADTEYGGDGNDILEGDAGDDELYGGLGADEFRGGTGTDWARYTSTNEGVFATSGVTVDLTTTAGSTGAAAGDTFTGIENVWGTGYADTIRTDSAANAIGGGGGNDFLEGRGGSDTIQGGLGADTIYGDYSSDPADGSTSAYADHGGDFLYGEAGNDIIYGGRGNDVLEGGDGDDTLYAQGDDDRLTGGLGNDVMYGGTGSDTYIVTRASGADIINNFNPTGTDVDVLGLQGTDGDIQDRDLWFEQIGSTGAADPNGTDLRITVIGSGSSVVIKNWYPAATGTLYRINFITTNSTFTKDIDVDGLVQLMRTKTKPTTIAARDTIMNDGVFYDNWGAFWHTNYAPDIVPVANQTVNDDGTLTMRIEVSDDVTPDAGISMSATALTGGSLLAPMTLGAVAADGSRTLTIKPTGFASGTAKVELVAADAGGHLSAPVTFTVTIKGTPNNSTVAGFSATPGTSGQTGGILVNLAVSFEDTDGSEVHEIRIAGMPTAANPGVRFGNSAGTTVGTWDSVAGVWKLTPAQLTGLRLYAPAGWSRDLTLTATAYATEGGETKSSAPVITTVVINALPTAIGFSGAVAENAPNGTIVGTASGVDPDTDEGDTLTYSLANNAGGRFAINAASGVVTVGNASLIDYEAAASHAITVRVTDSFGKYKDQAFTVGVNNVNEANSIPATYSLSVDENVAIGTIVDTVAATDPDDPGIPFSQQRYYFLNGTAASATSSDGRYVIDSVSGAIKTNAALNFEAANPSTTYDVIARDNAGAAGYNQVKSVVTIGIANVNEANSLPASYSFAVNENVTVGTTVGTVAATDIDASTTAFGQQRYYFLNGTAASATSSDGRYIIDALTGAIKTNAALNFEAGTPSVAYTVIARDNQGAAGYNQDSSTVTIGINNLNEANSIPASYSFAVNENVALGTAVGTVAATDLDTATTAFGQQRYYFLNGTAASTTSSDGRYAIDAITGAIKTNAALNYEAGTPSGTYTVVARDNAGAAGYNQDSSSVTIGINDVNEANNVPAAYSFGVNENVAVGTTVGTVAATDSDSSAAAFGQQRYYFLNGTAASATSSDGRYAIDAITGVIKTNAAQNHEVASPSVAYTVIARDNIGGAGYNQDSTTVTIGINDLNEANSVPASYSFGVNENVVSGTLVGTVAATDLDGASVAYGQQRYYFLNGTTASATSSDGRYIIDSATGAIRTNAALDYEAGTPSKTYTVIARDNAGAAGYNQVSTSVAIGINNVNEAPTLANHSFSVSEQPANPTAPLMTLNWGDPDGKPLNGHMFSIVGGDPNGYWSIDNAGRISSVKNLNFEDAANNAFTLRVRVTDQGGAGLATEADVTVSLTNVNESPAATSTGNTFMSWAPANSVVGSVVHNDPDAGDVMSYTIMAVENLDYGGGDPANYRVVSNGSSASIYTNGIVGSGGWQNRERITVKVTDSAGLASTTTFTVTYYRSQPLPPVVLDLDGDGIELVSRGVSGVQVDIDGDGALDDTGWVAPDDGFLALDRDGNGLVTDMGEVTFMSDVEGAVSDLEGLRAFDSDEDGFLDADDVQYGSFLVWRDLNQDGASQAGEVQSLAEAGITFINLMLSPTGARPDGTQDNVVYATGEYIRADGASGLLGDVMLSYGPSQTQTAPPIILDLDGNGVSTTELASNPVMFDMDGDGAADRTGWVGTGDGLLALDRNGDGVIAGISEISFVGDLAGARTDLQGLAAFDTNRDGLLSAADQRFGDFRIWIDADHDGVSDSGELKLLPELGIVSLSLEGEATGDPSRPGRNVVYNLSSFTRGDGSTGALGDVGLTFIASAGGGQAITGENAIVPAAYAFDGKSKHYSVETRGGGIFLQSRDSHGVFDPGVGRIAAAASLGFSDGDRGFGAAVVLDLDGDGVDLTRRKKAEARFDMDGDGSADDTGWVGKGDGILVLDRNGNGVVDGTGEMSFIGDRPGARTSLEGLAAFDSNRDGVLDSDDERFAGFSIWQDRNGDGRSSADELRTLEQAGIASINLRGNPVDRRWKRGRNVIVNTATFTRSDGSTGTVGDVGFAFKPSGPREQSAAVADVEDRLNALRAGLDRMVPHMATADGRRLGGSAFPRMPAIPNSVGADQADLSPVRADLFQSRLALAVQEMASFGSRSGETQLRDRNPATPVYDLFAA